MGLSSSLAFVVLQVFPSIAFSNSLANSALAFTLTHSYYSSYAVHLKKVMQLSKPIYPMCDNHIHVASSELKMIPQDGLLHYDYQILTQLDDISIILRPGSVSMGPFRFPIQMTISSHCHMGAEKWAFGNCKRDQVFHSKMVITDRLSCSNSIVMRSGWGKCVLER